MKEGTDRGSGTPAQPSDSESNAEYAVPVADTLNGNADANEAHAARNVAGWRKYLPADCVEAMIRLGWDKTV